MLRIVIAASNVTHIGGEFKPGHRFLASIPIAERHHLKLISGTGAMAHTWKG
jgi:hypothetical protein